jgi:hypothetical protein
MPVSLSPGAALALALAVLASACAPPEDESLPSADPDRASFPLVSDAIERHCATLDCHGSPARNLRLHTGTGLRLDPASVPGEGSTTPAEYEANYRAILGLEPELTRLVVAEHGASPERLTLVRKAIGLESHRPGAVLRRDAPSFRCLTSWLASATDKEPCKAGANVAPPAGWPEPDPP